MLNGKEIKGWDSNGASKLRIIIRKFFIYIYIYIKHRINIATRQ